MTIREEPAFGRGSIEPQPCIRLGPRTPNHDAAMRIGSEAPRRRTHSSSRHDSHESPRDSATSSRHRRPVTSGPTGPKLSGTFSILRSWCGTQNDTFWHNALPHQAPKGDQKLARQGHDHGLASAAGALGAGSKPLRQGAVLLEHEKSPRQLDHASSNPSVAGTGQPFLPASSAALVGRAREASITRYGPAVAHASRQYLLHQHVGRLDTDPDYPRQQAHHCVWSITGRLLETLQASVLDLPYLITDEPPAHHVATQLSQGVGRDRLPPGGGAAGQAVGGLLHPWV